MRSAFDLLTCYLTTGSQDCLDELTTDPDMRAYFEEWRERGIQPPVDQRDQEMQVVIFSDPDDPAVFEYSIGAGGLETVELAGGTLYYRQYVHPFGGEYIKWQAPNTREGIPSHYFEELRLRLQRSTDGKIAIVGMLRHIQENPAFFEED